MKLPQLALLAGLMLLYGIANAQPDYKIHATPVAAPKVDPAIARAIATIKPGQIEETIKTLVGFGTRNTMTSMDTNLPASQGINAAADWIAGQFESISHDCGGCLEVKRDTFTAEPTSGSRILKPTKITNVYAILRGSDPEQAKRMVLVTGHYDTINSNAFSNWADTSGDAPGANDDASGVAVSLACARALSKLKFPSTIVFATVAGEEEGLIGSGHLAKLAKSEGWELEAVLNNDIVGGNTTPGDTLQRKDTVRVFSEAVPDTTTPQELRRILALGKDNDSPSRELARAIAETDRAYFPQAGPQAFSTTLVYRPDRYHRGGDHTSFNHEGFAAVRFTEWREDFNHQHQNIVRPPAGSNEPVKGDLLEFVDFNYVAHVARLNAATLATLAFAPGEPQKLAIENAKVENSSTLSWESPEGGGIAHYQVLWRETTSPNWQYAKDVEPAAQGGTVTTTLPISKDNVYFGVRAVDAKGHRGLAVVP